jgi:hypothetical protein
MDFMSILKPAAAIGSVVLKSNPVAAGVLAAIEIVDSMANASDEERAEAYMEMAAGFLDVSAEIIRSVKDGKITEEEQKEILRDVKEVMSALT